MIYLTVGVTGHRDLREEEIPKIEARVAAFFQRLAQEFPDLPLLLLTPLAEGADQLVARVALSQDIPIVVILPMEQVQYETDFDSTAGLTEFRSLLARADHVVTLPPLTRGASSAPLDENRERQRQYAQLGIFISNHCQVLLALWDGKPGLALGGTGQVVRYHLTAVMEGFEQDPSPATLLAENENDLVYHIVCSRQGAGGDPEPGYVALTAAWFCSRNGGLRSQTLPPAYHALLDSLQQFVRDGKEHRPELEQNSYSLLEDAPRLQVPSGADLTNQLFQHADGLAIHYQDRVNLSLKATYILAGLMGLVFLVYSDYDSQRYLILVFLLLFFSGVTLQMIGTRREWHRKYLDYRALAEGLRVQLYWNLAGVVDSGSADFAYDNFLQKQDVELGWIRHVMRLASLQRDRTRAPDPGWTDWVIAQWIGKPDESRGQLSYYSRKQRINSERYRRTRILGGMCLWTGIVIASGLFFLGGEELAAPRQTLLILMGVLPLVAGIWDAYSHKKAEKELIKQYQFMSRIFTRARRLLDNSSDLSFRRLVLKALGQAALDEGAEWLLMHRERPPEHGGL